MVEVGSIVLSEEATVLCGCPEWSDRLIFFSPKSKICIL